METGGNADDKYPYYFENLSSADEQLVQEHYLKNSNYRDLGNNSGKMTERSRGTCI